MILMCVSKCMPAVSYTPSKQITTLLHIFPYPQHDHLPICRYFTCNNILYVCPVTFQTCTFIKKVSRADENLIVWDRSNENFQNNGDE